MSIERTEDGIWVVVGDTLRTPWVKERHRLDVDHLIPEICRLINPGDTVIDVGANIGDHTIAYMRSVGPDGRVIAFEPDPECFACCVLNCNTFDGMYNAAALDRRGNVGLNLVSNRGENFVLLDQPGGGILGFPIDDLDLDRCDLIKIDVEGAELLVINGAEQTIRRHAPTIVCELVESQLKRFAVTIEEVKARLSQLGYDGLPLVPGETRDWIFRQVSQ
jgi:FkbM family methyltransferase